MRFTKKLVIAGVFFASFLYAQTPKVEKATNAASQIAAGLPNYGIAKGARFVLRGSDLGPADAVVAEEFPLNTNLGGVSVRVTIGGESLEAAVVRASAREVVAVMPATAPEGTGTAVVSYNGNSSEPVNITVVSTAAGIFTASGKGTGAAVASNVNGETGERSANTLTNPARPGQTVIVKTTGLGDARDASAHQLFAGGVPAEIRSLKSSETTPGIDEIEFVVPGGDVDGCSVPVILQTGNRVSNAASIAVSAEGACKNPTGLDAETLNTAQQQGTLRTGSIDLSKSTNKMSFGGFSLDSKTDSASGTFARMNYDELIRLGGTNVNITNFGACTVFTFEGEVNVVNLPQVTPLDAGPAITIAGSNGTKTMRRKDGAYYAELGGGMQLPIPGAPAPTPEYLLPGDYRVDNGAGAVGPDSVGPFQATITVPTEFQWLNEPEVTEVNRGAGLPLTWTGGHSEGIVTIFGVSMRQNPDAGAGFVCTAKVSAGGFTVPAVVLLSLPQSSEDMPGSLILNASTPAVKFKAEGLDFGTLTFSDSKFKTVTYR